MVKIFGKVRLELFLLIFLVSFLQSPYINGQESIDSSLPNSQKKNDSLQRSSVVDSSDTTGQDKRLRDTVQYQADTIEYDMKNKIILLRGNGLVSYQNMNLYADTIHFMTRENIVMATGHPQMVQSGDTIVGEYLIYNFKTNRGKAKYGTGHLDNTHFDGKHMARSDDDNFYLEDGDYTSCAVIDSPHFCFYGKHIKYIPKDKIYSRPIVLNIGEAPVATLPYFIIPLDRGRRSGWLTPRWGGNPARGGHLDNIGYYWAPNDYLDYSLSANVSEFASFVAHGSVNYALRYWLTGGFSSRYSLATSHDTLNNIWDLNYSHNQNLLPDQSMRLTGRGNIVSGKSFYKSVSEDTTELLNQQITANLALTKEFRKSNIRSSLSWNRIHNFRTNRIEQDLPSFSVNFGNRNVFPRKKDEIKNQEDKTDEEKWYHKLSYSYSVSGNRKYSYIAGEDKRDSLFDFMGLGHTFSLTAPQKIFQWFTLNPSFSFNQSFYNAYIDTNAILNEVERITTDTIPADSLPANTILDTLYIANDTLYICSIGTYIDTYFVYDTTRFHWSTMEYPSKFQTYSWNTGISLSTKIYGIFPVKIFNFTGLRHTLSPSVSYTLYPKKDLDRRFPVVGVSYSGPQDRRQVVKFGLGNLFQGRTTTNRKTKDKDRPVENKFTILNSSLGCSYDFEAETRKWSNINLSASIPNKLIDFSYSSTSSPYDDNNSLIVPKLLSYSISLRPKLSGARGTFWGGDFIILEKLDTTNYMIGYKDLSTPQWQVNFSPSYRFTRSREHVSDKFKTTKSYTLSTSANIKFTHKWSVSWGSSFDFNKNKFMNHSINFHCDLECFDLRFDWYPSGFNRGTFNFVINIKKHPEIKWEHPDNG